MAIDMKTKGQIAYEQELEVVPYYHSGEHRKPWRELCDIAKQSWERNPIPRWEKSFINEKKVK